jgi:hypothetical protein
MKNRFLPLMISLFVAIVLVFVVEDFVRQVIVIPLLYASWFVTLVLGSLPQWVFWVVFVITALVIANKSMAQDKTIRRQPWTPGASHRGPVATWSALLERSKTQEFSRWRLAQALTKLTQDILFQEPFNLREREEGGADFKTFLPPQVEASFKAPLPDARLLSRLWRRRRGKGRFTAPDLDPEIVVKYLEDRLATLTGA